MSNLSSVIESLLFVSGEPLSVKKLSKIAGKPESEVEEAVTQLSDDCKNNHRGFYVARKEDEIQLVSASEFKEYVHKLVKGDPEEDLSRATLEVLAVVAYRGPISRAQIEEVRGVNCSFTLRNLLIRGLVERVENPNDSRSYLYKISFDFLKHLGLENVKELPNYADLNKNN